MHCWYPTLKACLGEEFARDRGGVPRKQRGPGERGRALKPETLHLEIRRLVGHYSHLAAGCTTECSDECPAHGDRAEAIRARWRRYASMSGGENSLRRDPDAVPLMIELQRQGIVALPTGTPERVEWESIPQRHRYRGWRIT